MQFQKYLESVCLCLGTLHKLQSTSEDVCLNTIIEKWAGRQSRIPNSNVPPHETTVESCNIILISFAVKIVKYMYIAKMFCCQKELANNSKTKLCFKKFKVKNVMIIIEKRYKICIRYTVFKKYSHFY